MTDANRTSPGSWLVRRRTLLSIVAHVFSVRLQPVPLLLPALRVQVPRPRAPWVVQEYLTYLPLALTLKLVVLE